MFQYSIKADGMKDIQARFKDKEWLRISVRAVNEVSRWYRTQVSREIRKTYEFKAREITQAMKITRASFNNPQSTIRVQGKRTPLIRFMKKANISKSPGMKRSQQTGKYPTVRVRKGKTLKVKGGFVAKDNKSGKDHIFVRIGKSQYPIKKLHTLSIPAAINTNKRKLLLSATSKRMSEVLLRIAAFKLSERN